jgi:hypothetical protein
MTKNPTNLKTGFFAISHSFRLYNVSILHNFTTKNGIFIH